MSDDDDGDDETISIPAHFIVNLKWNHTPVTLSNLSIFLLRFIFYRSALICVCFPPPTFHWLFRPFAVYFIFIFKFLSDKISMEKANNRV